MRLFLSVFFLLIPGIGFLPIEPQARTAPESCPTCNPRCPCGPGCTCGEGSRCSCSVPVRIQQSVVRIEVQGMGSGSGLLYRAGDGGWWVWTVAHVVRMAEDGSGGYLPLQVILPNGSTVPGYTWSADYDGDIALVQLRERNLPYPSMVWNHGPRPQVGTELYHAGCPRGEIGTGTVTSGIMSFVGRQYLGQVWDQVSTPAAPGSSGGGVFLRSNGHCIGLVARGGGETFILIVPEWRVHAFCQRRGFMWAFDPSGEVR